MFCFLLSIGTYLDLFMKKKFSVQVLPSHFASLNWPKVNFFPESNFFFSFSNIKSSFSPPFLLYFLFIFVLSFRTIVYMQLPLNIPQLYFWLLGVLLCLVFYDFNKTQVTDFKRSANVFFLLSRSFINIIFLQSRKYDIEKKIQLTIQTFLHCLTYFGAIIGTIFCKIKQPKDI